MTSVSDVVGVDCGNQRQGDLSVFVIDSKIEVILKTDDGVKKLHFI